MSVYGKLFTNQQEQHKRAACLGIQFLIVQTHSNHIARQSVYNHRSRLENHSFSFFQRGFAVFLRSFSVLLHWSNYVSCLRHDVMYYQLWTRCTVRRASYLPSSTTTNINFTSNQFIVQVIGWLVALHVTLPVHANIEKFLLVPLEWSKVKNLFFKKAKFTHFEMNWMPIGISFESRPIGVEMAGRPVKLQIRVKYEVRWEFSMYSKPSEQVV